MANPRIRSKRSSVEGKVPAASQLMRGEFAVNSYDGKVYILKDQTSVGIATTTVTVNPWSEPNGVGSGVSYSSDVNVLGVVTATSFIGDGSHLTGISVSGVSTFSGDYNHLYNKPTIPTNNNQLTNGAGYITGYTVVEQDVTSHQAALSITESQISDFGTYATAASVAGIDTSGFIGAGSTFSGNYNHLYNKPTIPTNNNQLTNGAGYITADDVGIATGSTRVLVDESEDDNHDYNILFTDVSPGAGNRYYTLQVDDGGLRFNPGTNVFKVHHIETTGVIYSNAYYDYNNSGTSYNFDSNGDAGILTNGTPNFVVGVDGNTRVTNSLNVSGIATAATLYTSNGTFNSGDDSKTDAAIVIQEEGAIYTKDGAYLRTLIEKKSDTINIGQQNTALIDGIELKPGNSSTNGVKLHFGGTGDNVKLKTTSNGVDVTGNITVSGTVDGVDVAALNSTVAGIDTSGFITDYTVTESDVTGHQAALSITESQISDLGTYLTSSDLSSYATTDYVDTEVAGLVDSAPGTLNTLNELAAALGDDANFSTTVTNSIAAKLPLAGGTMTGNITFASGQTFDGVDVSALNSTVAGIDTSGFITDYTVTESDVTGHQAALSITESQISDLGTYLRSDTADTMSGNLTVNARLDVGNGSGSDTEVRIYKSDNNVSDHIQFYNGTTRMGEIGCEDTTWLRINQETSKNIYTPRYIRADSGFFVDGTSKGINGSGNFIGGTISGASDYNTLIRSNASDNVTGHTEWQDTYQVRLGNSADMKLYHDSGVNYIDCSQDLLIRHGSETMIRCNDDSNVELYYDNIKKLETTSNGIDVTGNITVSGTVDGVDIAALNSTVAGIDTSGFITSGSGLDADTVDGIQASSFLRSDGDDSFSGLLTGSGRISITGTTIECGRTSGSVAMTTNDGGGNANLCFNHKSKIPDVSGSSCRIEASVDSNTGSMTFEVGNSVTSGTSVNLSSILKLKTSEITAYKSILPNSNNSRDLGSSSLRFRNVYTNDLNLSNEGGANDVDGTWGDWTMQEGENDMFMINNRTGNKFRIKLEPVE